MKSVITSRLSRNFDSFSPRCQKLIDDLRNCREIVQVSTIHGYMVKTAIDKDDFAASKFIASSISQDINYASSIFQHFSNTNLYMFNTIFRGYSMSVKPEQAFRIFNQLRRTKRFTLDRFSFTTTLKSCARKLSCRTGEGIHGIVLRSGFMSFTDLSNALLHFYCVRGKINDARKVFDEMLQRVGAVSFTTLMNGYLVASKPVLALDLFRDMRETNVSVSISMLLSLLSAIGDDDDLGDLESGYAFIKP